MLGELLYEETGNTTGLRVLPPEGGAVNLEVSLQAAGRIQGVEHTSMWTYVSTTRADGSIFGEGRGVLTTADGDGTAPGRPRLRSIGRSGEPHPLPWSDALPDELGEVCQAERHRRGLRVQRERGR